MAPTTSYKLLTSNTLWVEPEPHINLCLSKTSHYVVTFDTKQKQIVGVSGYYGRELPALKDKERYYITYRKKTYLYPAL